MVLVYKKKNFNIYGYKDKYIIHNTNKEFSKGHTHIKNFKTAKFLIDLSIHKSIPKHHNKYFLVSLLRISDDKEYSDKLSNIIDKLEKKKCDRR